MPPDIAGLVSGHDYALLHRAESGHDRVTCLIGSTSAYGSVRSAASSAQAHHLPSLLLVPFRQLAERGFDAVDDEEELLLLTAREVHAFSPADFEGLADGAKPKAGGGAFLDTDAEYRAVVQRIITDEISRGAGSNFVIKRTYVAELDGVDDLAMLTAFADLLRNERGAYWTFLVRTGDLYVMGATPERHVSVTGRRVTMNPISGTVARDAADSAAEKARLLAFLSDSKESDELSMVLDEELKMLASLCEPGSLSVTGPGLRHMSRVTHTEFTIEGRTRHPLSDVLVHTMFSPAVTGSPIRNACRVIARHEPHGRSYYAGYLGLFEPAGDSTCSFDSAINIRSAQVRRHGEAWRMRADVGATLVRNSSPQRELAETQAKAAAVLSAVCGRAVVPGDLGPTPFGPPEPPAADDPDLARAIGNRRTDINPLWFGAAAAHGAAARRAVLVDAEDDFNSMLAHQLSAFGYAVDIVPNAHAVTALDDDALVVFGPGPGDPCDRGDARVVLLERALTQALATSRPFLAVCLSHQILCRVLGLTVRRLAVPNQGVARSVDWFGSRRRLGFYNAFAAVPGNGPRYPVQVTTDSAGDVTGLVGHTFVSMQFHPESALSVDGTAVLADALRRLENP
ncbi:phenazine biosynthesis protein phzE [Kitasatospora sp. SolWspMP-SS2h]|uniref:chorismate-binding protein n=1 Tax=Kitasatospora sp. SolWspMP-SS2h TaxID=1305729 RepID=UPI000DB9D8E9|nr:chorismate-binding protein [Kitasatospora sp. SolWspMP-SS2h]RAJ43064.1 phenazine biosynthesis protein phzE [Kitasatospora sp. SolWspMP-SS2h]